MENMTGAAAIVGTCLLVLLIGSMKRKSELLLNFVLRAVFGTIAVCLLNSVLTRQGIQGTVGIGPFSFLTSGFLGFPGVALLYGINFYFLL